ncbi:MAG: sensor histidine kinase [Salinisphaera sp.]|nr:sensor histidine kinase [Salinisphaera sp.]
MRTRSESALARDHPPGVPLWERLWHRHLGPALGPAPTVFELGAGAETPEVDRQLQRAEQDICWLREPGLVGWFVVLLALGYDFGAPAVWLVYAGGLLYAAWAHWRANDLGEIRRTAIITTLCDPVLAGAMCLVTGGLHSVFYAFFFFTQVSVAIRFGARESLYMVCFNGLLTMLIYFIEPVYSGQPTTLVTLGTTLFVLGFAGLLGVVMAGWARQSTELMREQAGRLRRSGERLREVLRRLADVQEEERRNISGELHDRMSGHLFSLRQGLEQSMHANMDRPEQQQRLAELAVIVRECTRDVRAIMNDLRPTVLDELGFFEAASEYLNRLADSAPFALQIRIDPTLHAWRSRQEALLNAHKHAHARQVQVSLAPQDNEVVLRIVDDGCGFEAAEIPVGHYGLMTMRERAEAAGGRLAVAGGPDRGTQVEVRLPRRAQA